MPRLKGRWAWAGLAAGLVALLLANRGFRRLVSNYLTIRRLQNRLAAMQGEEAGLHNQIDSLHRDDAVLEGMARKELGYLKRNEVEYRFPPPQ